MIQWHSQDIMMGKVLVILNAVIFLTNGKCIISTLKKFLQ